MEEKVLFIYKPMHEPVIIIVKQIDGFIVFRNLLQSIIVGYIRTKKLSCVIVSNM